MNTMTLLLLAAIAIAWLAVRLTHTLREDGYRHTAPPRSDYSTGFDPNPER